MPEAPSEYYTSRYSGEEIDRGIDGALQLGGATSKQQALRAIGGRPNRNLLDNWYFVGGGSQQGGGQFPINQRGQTSYKNAQTLMCTIDRWILGWSKTMTITESGLVFDPAPELFQQTDPIIASQLIGSLITITVLDSENHLYTVSAVYNGTDTITDPDVRVSFTPSHGGKPHSFLIEANNVIAAKLELGPTQTLAYQDESGAWQLFETPDYAEELAKCQRYYWDSGAENFGGCSGIGSSTATLTCACQFPVTMRTAPAIRIYNGTTENQIRNSSNGAVVNVQTAASYANRSGLSFLFDPTNNLFQVGAGYDFRVVASAEL